MTSAPACAERRTSVGPSTLTAALGSQAQVEPAAVLPEAFLDERELLLGLERVHLLHVRVPGEEPQPVRAVEVALRVCLFRCQAASGGPFPRDEERVVVV